MRCKTDDCDQVHCGKCGEHTVGNTLVGGMCQGCYDGEYEDYNNKMQAAYNASLIGVDGDTEIFLNNRDFLEMAQNVDDPVHIIF